MNALRKIFIVSLALIVLGAPGHTSADEPDDILIIVNKSIRVERLSEIEIKLIFLKKKTHLNGKKINAFNAKENSELRAAFQQRVIKMNAEEEGNYWQDQKVRTGLRAPPEFGDTRKAVFHVANSLSYVFRKQHVEGVYKVVAVIPK